MLRALKCELQKVLDELRELMHVWLMSNLPHTQQELMKDTISHNETIALASKHEACQESR